MGSILGQFLDYLSRKCVSADINSPNSVALNFKLRTNWTWPQILQASETSLKSDPYKVAPIKHLECMREVPGGWQGTLNDHSDQECGT